MKMLEISAFLHPDSKHLEAAIAVQSWSCPKRLSAVCRNQENSLGFISISTFKFIFIPLRCPNIAAIATESPGGTWEGQKKKGHF